MAIIPQAHSTLNTLEKDTSSRSLGTTTNTTSASEPKIGWIIKKYRLQSVSRNLLPNQRICICLRRVVPHKNHVDIFYDDENKHAHYRNLMRCTSVWHCPICASAITEKRKQELALAISNPDLHIVMLTFTMSHKRRDTLRSTLDRLKGAYDKFHAGRPYQRIKRDFGILGAVRTLEDTHGINGWHPHIHQLLFLEKPIDEDEFETLAKTRWLEMLSRVGGSGSWRRALDLKSGDRYISEYIVKWGHNPRNEHWTVEDEITKQPVKSGRKGGYTPFELLAVAGGLESTAYSQRHASKLFIEYALTMKGSNQLVWSRGLKKLFGIGEKSDHEIIDEQSLELPLLARLTMFDWGRVLHYKQRAQLIALASEGDAIRVYQFLNELKDRYEKEKP